MGAVEEKRMNAVNGGKTHSEAVVRRPAIYSRSPEGILATGLEARRYDAAEEALRS